jgi:hypothetical protein
LHGEPVVLEHPVLAQLVLAHTVLAHIVYFRAEQNFYAGVAAFLLQHRRDVARQSIAEQLAEFFFVVRDAVLVDEPHEVGWSIAGERRFDEVWIGRKEIIRSGMQVGEIAAAASGDQDLLADSIRAFKY